LNIIDLTIDLPNEEASVSYPKCIPLSQQCCSSSSQGSLEQQQLAVGHQ